MTFKFSIGQTVEYKPRGRSIGLFKVIRHMRQRNHQLIWREIDNFLASDDGGAVAVCAGRTLDFVKVLRRPQGRGHRRLRQGRQARLKHPGFPGLDDPARLRLGGGCWLRAPTR